MKNLLLFLFLIISFSNINAQEKGVVAPEKGCSVTSNFTYTKSSCSTVHFTANPSSNSTTVVLGYFWDFGNGNTSTSQNPPSQTYTNGNYTVTLTVIGVNTVTGDCCCDTYSEVVNINCGPPCGISIGHVEHLAHTYPSYGLEIHAVPNLSLGWTITHSTFELTFSDGTVLLLNGTLNQNGYPHVIPIVYCTNTVVAATIRVWASNGRETCHDTKTVGAEVFGPIGACGWNGIGNQNALRVGPNPANTTLSVDVDKRELGKDIRLELVIQNLNGGIEQQHTISNHEVSKVLNVSKLKSGLYIVKLIHNGEVIETQKVRIND